MWSGQPQQTSVTPLDPEREREAFAATVRIARRIERLGRPVLGLAPVNGRTKVAPTAFHLAHAMADFTASEVAVVAAGGSDSAYEPLRAQGEEVLSDGSFVLSLAARVRLFVCERQGDAHALVSALAQARQRSGRVLCDLTGLERVGVLDWMFPHLDGLLLVAGAGRTKEGEIASSLQRVHSPIWRQVLLVGG
jgi:hypothetical protein